MHAQEGARLFSLPVPDPLGLLPPSPSTTYLAFSFDAAGRTDLMSLEEDTFSQASAQLRKRPNWASPITTTFAGHDESEQVGGLLCGYRVVLQ